MSALELAKPDADVFVPDEVPLENALARVERLGIGSHADDLEIMAWHGIELERARRGFGGVVCTDGRGAPRGGPHAGLDDAALRELRRAEQREAATRGDYAVAIQLDHASAAAKSQDEALLADLRTVLARTRPRVVYTHNPMDRHATHVAVCAAVVAAVRALPAASRPAQLLGCEVWGGLEWLGDDAVALPIADEAGWRAAIACHDSQIAGGRPYPEGSVGRSRANAVFSESHATGGDGAVWLAVDLTPLTRDGAPSLDAFVGEHVARFEERLRETLAQLRPA